ncbi:MAG: bifunctional (p)ppGpp synthetase/guanosine-3',5'-bis(diphosphate) 3'-pyrophosphohydrolase [Patescibacteria group bacterium]|nr:bifunctional (p)ppGpp synthetase/guanosine-3',5'-bis(diphosphate) 3'-pyrophosphohydrolase [Patescibacteria group bacterium]
MTHPTDDIIQAMKSHTTADQKAIQDAYDFAEKAHGDEKRKSGEPYIIHPHAIARTLAELGMGRDTIVAGILHDTIEDTTVTPEEIEGKFGAKVRFLVEGVTKLSKLKYRGLERHVESMRRLFVATANDIRVIIIKLADRLHNMQTLQYVDPTKQKRIALETKEVYVPIAERLGIGVIKSKLEDLAFKTLEPEKYAETETFLHERSETEKESLDKAVNDLRKALAEAGMRKFYTESRVKNVHSFAKKLARKGNDPDKVYDIFAVRIIVPTMEDCYRALGIIHKLWRPLPGRVKDYIAIPKPNGYRTLHTTIITPHKLIVEIQIRSEEMQRESKFGVAAHYLYKEDPKKPIEEGEKAPRGWAWRFVPSLMRVAKGAAPQLEPSASAPRWLQELNTAAEEFREESAFQKALRDDFFAERMFVFTPKGDVMDLPVGATPVDFAYAIHSDIGNTMTGAKVNGKIAPLASPLRNGDIVEILTKKSAKPNKKWLDFVKTSGAKHHIRNETNRQKN